MRNFLQNGDRMKLLATKKVKAGHIVVVGELVGAAFDDYDPASDPDGEGVVCAMSGIFTQPKATGAWAQGQALYQDENGIITTVADGNVKVGVAADVATVDAAEGPVRL